LEITSLLDDSVKIKSARIVAYHKNDYLGEDVFKTFKTIEDFNKFFVNNRRYYLHNCELSLEDNMIINTHDDSEASIHMPMGYKNRTLIKGVLSVKGLSESLIEEIIQMPGYYFSINGDGKVESAHKTFNDYLDKNK
jgi:hypothetical protein